MRWSLGATLNPCLIQLRYRSRWMGQKLGKGGWMGCLSWVKEKEKEEINCQDIKRKEGKYKEIPSPYDQLFYSSINNPIHKRS